MPNIPTDLMTNNSHSGNVSSDKTAKQSALTPESFAYNVKGKKGLARIIKATSYSIDGFKAAYSNEAAFRQVFWLNLALLLGLVLLPFAITVKMILLFASFLSLIVELINTGLEASIDHTSTEQHPLAKIAKDVGSAAQFLALLLLFSLWMMALFSISDNLSWFN